MKFQKSNIMNPYNDHLPLVMLIEDNVYIHSIISHVLGDRFKVLAFNNGIDALAYMQNGNFPDIIISDINMPGLGGFQLLQQLKSSGFFSSIPVIMLSGEDSSDTRIKFLEAGADDFMVKPFNPRELETKLKITLKRAGKLASC
jgi:DNA-binding response OmpR family regulator